MKRYIFFVLLIIPTVIYAQYKASCFIMPNNVGNRVERIGLTTSSDTVISLKISGNVDALSISGKASFNEWDKGHIRVTLLDDYNYEYLVYELYPLLADSLVSTFSRTAMETCVLYNESPHRLKISVTDATLVLDSVYYGEHNALFKSSRQNLTNLLSNQEDYIIEKLNEHLEARQIPWRAGKTSLSCLTYEEKKGFFGNPLPNLGGFEYYKSGVFVMPNTDFSESNTKSESLFVPEFDWRNRHGKNWVTSVKFQGNCNSCSAFSSIGTFESYINLYYNQLLNYDLSEQEVISCGHVVDCEEGGYMIDVLQRIMSMGSVPEECFEYTATNNYCYNKCDEPSDILSFGGYSDAYTTHEDSIKRMLFKSPICFGNRYWNHFFVLIGYKQVQSGNNYFTSTNYNDTISILPGNPLIGHPAWLIKNSMGEGWGMDGFGYVAMSLSDAYGVFKITGNVSSQVLNDSDIVCEDSDGDGYYNWGLGSRPSSCPVWAPEEEDGDDSDCTKGPIDEYGNLQIIDPDELDTIYIDYDITYSTPQYIGQHIKVCNESYMTISNHLFCCKGVSITIEEGSLLIVSGGELCNVILKPQQGSGIIIDEGGRIRHNKSVNLRIPKGVTLKQRWGIIE